MLEFLTHLYDSGLGYSALNTARSALSQIITTKRGHMTVGNHPWVVRFMRGVYNLRTPTPRYSDTWDVGQLLRVLRRMSPVAKLSLKDLTLKLTALVAIILAARPQMLVALKLHQMVLKKAKACFTIASTDLKQGRPGYTPELVVLHAYPVDRGLCVLTVLTEYLKRTEDLRGNENQLFISYIEPHARVSIASVSRWVKTMMVRARIDTSKYKPHSIRAASSSRAHTAGVPLEAIMKTAGWTNAKTFANYYNKQIKNTSQYSEAVLSK